MRWATSTIFAIAASASPALAQTEQPLPFRLALSAGSLGIGPEVTYQPSRWFAIRSSAAFLSFGAHRNVDDIRYDGRLRLRNYLVTGDIHPFGNGWRLSAGIGSNGNRMRLDATPAMPVQVGNRTYTPAQIGTLSGKVRTRDIAPVLTLGYGGPVASHFSIGADAGVMFQGRPRMGPVSSTTTLISPDDLAAEGDKIRSDVRHYRFYPVVQLSAGYRF